VPVLGAFLYDSYGFNSPILTSLALTFPVILALASIEERWTHPDDLFLGKAY